MTINQICDVCVRELVFGALFLEDYQKELDVLSADTSFVKLIEEIGAMVPKSVEFSLNQNDPAFLRFKKNTISDAFFQSNVKQRYAAFRDIADSVLHRGQTGLSAAISVYYAVRYLTITRTENKSAEKKSVAVSDKDFRRKWPANYRCEDGHYVRSKNEQLVDNWLYHHNVCHAYEPLVVDKQSGREYLSDFFIPHIALYIEVWGYETAEYLQRKASKIEVYQSNHLLLLQLTDEDVKNLDDCLKRNILVKMI